MAVTAFQDLPLADRDRAWDGAAAEKRVRRWADAHEEPNDRYRDAHVWYDADKSQNSHGPGQEPPDEVLQEDGRHSAVGGVRGLAGSGAIAARELPRATQ